MAICAALCCNAQITLQEGGEHPYYSVQQHGGFALFAFLDVSSLNLAAEIAAIFLLRPDAAPGALSPAELPGLCLQGQAVRLNTVQCNELGARPARVASHPLAPGHGMVHQESFFFRRYFHIPRWAASACCWAWRCAGKASAAAIAAPLSRATRPMSILPVMVRQA
jgi:hypothetical protein